MGKLQVLPASLANMIAAGEVVQRPSSVVKELMENAIDAGADKVTVVVTDAGRTLIQVIDNGCGMSPSDAVLCFERHATSKIATQDDLTGILTFGFRGEALASIAAVSEVTLKTRRSGDETGTEVRIFDQGKVKTSVCQTPVGSNFAVRNLFYNTPARRRFLKSDNAELKHIIEEFTRVAITRPEVSFSLSHNGRDIFSLKKAQSLKFRILDLIGTGVAGDVLDFETTTTLLKVSGFVGRPDTARKTVGNQFFFVNGRYFRSAYLHKAVMQAYENLIPDGYTPSYFIFLDIDPESVDVNVSPTKNEVKFEEESLVYQAVLACVKEVLGKGGLGAELDFDSASGIQMPVLGSNFKEYSGFSAPSTVENPSYDPFKPNYDFSSHTDRQENYGKLFEEKSVPQSDAFVVQGKYIVAPSASGVMVVNVRRAYERIIFERVLKALSEDGGHVSQQALFPVKVQVGAAQAALFEENLELLASLGFGIEMSGTDSVEICAVPEGFSCEPGVMETVTEDLCRILSEEMGPGLPEILRQRLAGKMAALSGCYSGMMTNSSEAGNLLSALLQSSNPEFTPGGNRIITVLDAEKIDKMFQ